MYWVSHFTVLSNPKEPHFPELQRPQTQATYRTFSSSGIISPQKSWSQTSQFPWPSQSFIFSPYLPLYWPLKDSQFSDLLFMFRLFPCSLPLVLGHMLWSLVQFTHKHPQHLHKTVCPPFILTAVHPQFSSVSQTAFLPFLLALLGTVGGKPQPCP